MAKPIYEMGIDELVDFINSETKTYAQAVLDDQEIPEEHYFGEERFTDEALYNLFFACQVMYETLIGAESVELLDNRTLQMYEPLQVEFRKRLGHPDAYGASTVIKM